MLGTVLQGPRNIRCESVDEPKILKPTDAIIKLAALIFGPFAGCSR